MFRLRPDLRCSLRESDGALYYAVEDPASGRFYRIGVREWELACRLDGATRLADAAGSMSCDSPGASVSLQRAEQLVLPLVNAGLVVRLAADGRVQPQDAKASATTQALSHLNPFFIRVPLLRPDRLLESLLPWCRWLFCWQFLVIWGATVALGAYAVSSQWQRFTQSAHVYLAPNTWVYLWFGWFLLKVVHECAHGLVCKKYGGSVGSAGLALILFAPVAFVDVTSAWRFRSKRQRIFTSAAGMYIELFIAGAAAIAWSYTETVAASQICHSLVLMASVSTLLFNANPLMRFDGYFILSDLLGIDNLYGLGQQFVRNLFRRHFMGLPTLAPNSTSTFRRYFTKIYGVAAALWRVMVCGSMILIAATLFHGAGLIIALLGAVMWFGLPMLRIAKLLVAGQQLLQPNRIRFAGMTALTLAIAGALLWLPWPGGVSASGIIVYAPEAVVRTDAKGFVANVHVAAGQHVRKTQLLVTLTNDELQTQLAMARLAAEQSAIRARILLNSDDQHAAYQAELEQLAALQKRHSHLQSRIDGLEVRASLDGVVLGERLDDLRGRYIDVGVPLMKIVREESKEIHVAIPEYCFDAFSQSLGMAPHARACGASAAILAGKLIQVDPQASVVLRNFALASAYGGPLPVRRVRATDNQSTPDGPMLELATPHFHGVIALTDDEARRLRSGQLAKVRIHDSGETLGRRVYRTVKRWVERKLSPGVVASR